MQTRSREQLIGGTVLFLIGLLILYLTNSWEAATSQAFTAFSLFAGGGILCLIGLLLLMLPRHILAPHFLWTERISWSELIFGLLFALVGVFIIAMSIWDTDSSDFPSGRMPATAAGVAFFLAGTLVMRSNGIKGRDASHDLLTQFLATVLLTAFAAVPIGIVADAAQAATLSDTAILICPSVIMVIIAVVMWFSLINVVRKRLTPFVAQNPLIALLATSVIIAAIIAAALAIQRATEPR